jgi:hypothetical protein
LRFFSGQTRTYEEANFRPFSNDLWLRFLALMDSPREKKNIRCCSPTCQILSWGKESCFHSLFFSQELCKDIPVTSTLSSFQSKFIWFWRLIFRMFDRRPWGILTSITTYKRTLVLTKRKNRERGGVKIETKGYKNTCLKFVSKISGDGKLPDREVFLTKIQSGIINLVWSASKQVPCIFHFSSYTGNISLKYEPSVNLSLVNWFQWLDLPLRRTW